MKICRKCGTALRDEDKFCNKCGARAPSVKSEERRKNAEKRKQEKEITFRTRPANARGFTDNFEEGENRSHALLVTVTVLVVMMLAVAAFAMFYFVRKRSQTGRSGYGSAIEIITDSSVQENAPAESAASGDSLSAADAAAPGDGLSSADAGEPEDGKSSDIVVITQDESQAPEAAPDGESGEQSASSPEGQPESEPVLDAQAGTTPEGQSEAQTETIPAGQQKAQTETTSEAKSAAQTETTSEEQTEAESEELTETEAPGLFAADVIDPEQIRAILDSESTATSSEVYVYDLKHDSEAAVNDCTQPMYASALITVPILYTAAHQIDAGAMTMDDPITYVTTIGGRGELTTELRDGLEFPLSFYLQTMVHYSDNNCINILIDYIGLDTINAVCQEAGFTSVNMERGLVALDPGGLDNYVSAKDMTMMVKELYTGSFDSIGTDFMKEYFHISEGDSLPTLAGLAPSLSDASVLNQNGHGMTRYNETASIEDGNALYILTIMLHGDSGMTYSPAVTDVSEYVASAMAG